MEKGALAFGELERWAITLSHSKNRDSKELAEHIRHNIALAKQGNQDAHEILAAVLWVKQLHGKHREVHNELEQAVESGKITRDEVDQLWAWTGNSLRNFLLWILRRRRLGRLCRHAGRRILNGADGRRGSIRRLLSPQALGLIGRAADKMTLRDIAQEFLNDYEINGRRLDRAHVVNDC